MKEDRQFAPACPLPSESGDTIQLAHGGGGRMMTRLLDEVIRPAFGDAELDRRHDGALLALDGPTAFTTDSYVVQPLFFPGGDIGSLAVNGTVNDLAMCGARPICLSVGLILEEGLPLATLRRILASMRSAADACRLRLVTGDTKVVDRGKGDGVFINTAGIGRVVARAPIGPQSVHPGDAIILSGDIGRHGIAVMAAREGLGFETPIESDCAPLVEPALALVEGGIPVHCLRDLTRGGLASAMVEIAESSGLAIELDEKKIPVRADIAAACELLGLDPLHVANEGRFAAFVPADDAGLALSLLRRHPVTQEAAVIGQVKADNAGRVSCSGPLGVARAVDMLSGEQLPRIC
ncbi:hydrogenase expression/formation protein HypE [Desertibaculum subflavum]|uniref:hydrogenase expression/formation protein HypE n=1 Tax=Desertibaculum subflavum TaxID=2268458 RepID=UPI000E67227E